MRKHVHVLAAAGCVFWLLAAAGLAFCCGHSQATGAPRWRLALGLLQQGLERHAAWRSLWLQLTAVAEHRRSIADSRQQKVVGGGRVLWRRGVAAVGAAGLRVRDAEISGSAVDGERAVGWAVVLLLRCGCCVGRMRARRWLYT
ncbi:hypothetical protein BX070DRAFT_223986 [Coemansia spiralis]|nr:hypothetical protein BX070DRAFT_223986 [Coemansia spiralis]